MSTNQPYIDKFVQNFNRAFDKMERDITEGKWRFSYDEHSDILYLGGGVSKDSVLVPAGDSGISARIGADGVEAIVVEEFGSFFVHKNLEFVPLYERLTEKVTTEDKNTFRRACNMLLSDLSTGMAGSSHAIA